MVPIKDNIIFIYDKQTGNQFIMMHINFNPFPVLESERLLLRPISEADLPEVARLRSDNERRNFHPNLTAEEYARAHITHVNRGLKENKFINWGITLKGSSKLAGLVGLVKIHPKNYRAELGYVLNSESRGKGLMHETIKLVLSYGFNRLELNSVIAVINLPNQPSEKLLTKLGFVKEAHLRENIFYNGEFIDTVIYALLRKNYRP